MEMCIQTQRGFVVLVTLAVLPIYCKICLTWDIVNNHINLKCKTDNLQFKVLFLDSLEREYGFCFLSIPESICQVHYINGKITQDLLTNETQLTIAFPKDNENKRWTCRHGYNYEEAAIDIKPDYKHDIISPEIRTNQTLPFEDGSVVELTCSAVIYGPAATLAWNCMDIEAINQPKVNCTQYTSKIIYTAAIQDSGRVCKCIATMHSYSFSSSIKFDISNKFSLDIQDKFECNSSDEVKLSCRIAGNSSSFGFDSWTHTFNGVFIRHLKGIDTGETSVISIKPCQFFDCGEYTCRAWIRGNNGLKWIHSVGELTVRGPPFIIDTKTQYEPFFIFSVQFVSIPSAYFLKWCSADKVLNISSKYNQTSTEDAITVHMYGVPVAIAGYTATLTVQSKNDIGTDEHISLILFNMLGQASCSFKLWKDSKGFNFQIVQWGLVAVAVLIIAATTTLFIGRRKKKDLDTFTGMRGHQCSNANIYYAAPIEDNEPNIYNDLRDMTNHHRYSVAAIPLEKTKTRFQEDSSKDSQHYMYIE